ncbi:protein starmaker-like isoform X2 [Haliotis cracherodii]|uniref:protein starmaker-like isoform X2 n=1 Tax=Haliotis cracherodii TaxID=6455 RepID=UPI0039EAA951
MNKPNSLLIGIFLSISGSILFGHIIEASPVNPSVVKRDDSIGFENDDFKGQLPVENREEQARLPNTDLGQDDRVGIELDELEEGKRKEPVEGYVGEEPLRGDLMEGKEAVSSHSALVDDLLPSSIQEGVGNNAEANTSYSRLTDANHQDDSKTELGLGQQVIIEAESRHIPDNQEQHTVSVPGQDIQDSHKAPLVLHDSTQQPLVLQDQQGTKQNHDQASNQQPSVNQGLNQQLEQQGSNQQLPLQQGSDQQLPLQQGSNQQVPLQHGSDQSAQTQYASNQQLPLQHGSDQQLPLQRGSYQQLPLQQGSDQQLPLQQGSNQQVPLQHGSDQSAQTQYASNQKLPLQHGSDQQLPLQHGSYQQLPLQHGSDQQLPLQQGSNQQVPLQHGSDQSAQTQYASNQKLPLQHGSDQQLPLQHGSDPQHPLQRGSDQQLPLQRGSDQRDTNLNQNQGLSKSQNAVTNSYLNQNQKSYLQQVLQNKVQSESLQTDGTKQSGNDVPEEFKVEDNQPLDGSSEPAAPPKDHYSDDGYLDPPANNLDTDRSLSDKGDEDMGHNANLYDEDGEADTRLNNKNIIDDNNEQAVYNGDNGGSDRKAEQTDDNDEKDQGVDDDYDDYSYEDKDEKDGYEGHDEIKRTSTSTTPTKDDWYGDRNEEDGDDGVDGILDKEDEDYSDPDIDQELEFQQTHHMKPHTDSKGEEFFNDNMKTNFKEGLVENKLLKNRVGLNAPSSMVLFYTWIILIVLIAVVSLSAFRYRCKGMIMNGRNFRNGNHGNYRHERPGEENKRLLENVYT